MTGPAVSGRRANAVVISNKAEVEADTKLHAGISLLSAFCFLLLLLLLLLLLFLCSEFYFLGSIF